MSAVNTITLQKALFPMGSSSILDDNGFLTDEVVARLRRLKRDLRAKDASLYEITAISEHTWNGWLGRRRSPDGAALAFLKVLVGQPEIVLNTLQSGQTNYETQLAA